MRRKKKHILPRTLSFWKLDVASIQQRFASIHGSFAAPVISTSEQAISSRKNNQYKKKIKKREREINYIPQRQ
jgi:hypothetical protein